MDFLTELLSENGNSRKIRMSVKYLLNQPIYVPKCQRSIIDEHVQEIVSFQKQYFKKRSHYLFLNCIQYCSVDNKWYCVDGQHRYASLKFLDDLPDWRIDVEVTECKDMAEVDEIFRNLNKNTPVPEWFKWDEDPREVAFEFKKYIQKKYAPYISSSTKPQRPNIHLDSFIDNLDKIKHVQYTSFDEVVEWFEAENNEQREYLTNNNNEQCEKLLVKINSATKTRNGNKFYLGCFWLDPIPNKISAIAREKCWTLWYAECRKKQSVDGDSAPCYICEKLITAFSFEAGHIKSHANGGTNKVDNLRPVCNKCNKCVGSKNMDDYKLSMKNSLEH